MDTQIRVAAACGLLTGCNPTKGARSLRRHPRDKVTRGEHSEQFTDTDGLRILRCDIEASFSSAVPVVLRFPIAGPCVSVN
eukprot:4930241-Pleurochrysis_carterae.AAC.8